MAEKPVDDFRHFESRYGGTKHHIHHLQIRKGRRNFNSFYLQGNKIKPRVPSHMGKAKIQNVTRFSKLPQIQKYRSGVPTGWRGEPYRHSLSAQGIPNATTTRKPRQHRGFTIHDTGHGFQIIPHKTQLDENFHEITNPEAKKVDVIKNAVEVRDAGINAKGNQLYEYKDEQGNKTISTQAPPVTSEFALNKQKNITLRTGHLERKSLGERMIESGHKIRATQEGYGELRTEAKEYGAVAPPDLQEVGAQNLKRDIDTISFYGTKTGQAVKIVGQKLGEMKEAREKKEREKQRKEQEKRYNQAQERAQEIRIQQLEIQKAIGEKRLKQLNKKKIVEPDKTGIQELAQEAKQTETPEELAKDYASV